MYNFRVKRNVFFSLFIFAGFVLNAQNKTYFISSTGNDANNGLTIDAPWKTIDKVNEFPFQPGDAIHFEGGKIFQGTIKLNQRHSGLINEPLTIKSYGREKAIIMAGYANGIEILNAEFIEVRDLIIKGDGIYKNDGQGIRVFTERSDKMLNGILIDNVEVSGFYWSGISVGAASEATKGFYNLKITHSSVFENGFAGIQTWGAWNDLEGKSLFNHVEMYIGFTKAYNNYGISNYTYNWSGTGIIMAGVENSLIEYCEAYNNGKDNGCNTGGPVGIWLANAKNSTIQYCESYNNKAGRSKDGGGFDIDGGSQNCIIQYCYSHENEGPGYAFLEWGNNIPFTGNVIRYNISQNDARKNSYGAITLWGSDASHKLLNCEVYNNSIYLSKENIINGTPSAVKFINQQMKGVKISNNIFYTTDGTRMLYSASAIDTSIAHFLNNNYFDTSGKPNFYAGYNYTSFLEWKKASNGQEMRNSKSYGITNNPGFTNPGGGVIISPASGGNLGYLTAYMVNPGSEVIDLGINLKEEFGLHMGEFDFYQNRLTGTTNFDLGANEFNAGKFMVMPLKFLRFDASYIDKYIIVDWQAISDEFITKFELELSYDGSTFIDLETFQIQNHPHVFNFREKVKLEFDKVIYLRMKYVTKLGKTGYSDVITLKNNNEKLIRLYPNPVTEQLNFDLTNELYQKLTIRNISGQAIYQKQLQKGTINTINVKNFNRGFYSAELGDLKGEKKIQLAFIKE